MKEKHNRVLLTLDSSLDIERQWLTPAQIQFGIGNDMSVEEVKDSLDYLFNNDYVEKSGDSKYKITKEGIEYAAELRLTYSIDTLDTSIDKLKYFQSKSSAVETVFTLSLIFFAYLQLINSGGDSKIALILSILTVFIALTIGGVNFVKVFLKEAEEKIQYFHDSLVYFKKIEK